MARALTNSLLFRLGSVALARSTDVAWVAPPLRKLKALEGGSFGYGSMPDPSESGSEETQQRGWGQTKIRDVLGLKKDHGAWLYCSMDDLVFDAVKKMTKANVGSLLVFDPSKMHSENHSIGASSDAVVGIITERDYLTKMVVEGKSSRSTSVAEIMTPHSKLMTVTPDHTVVETMEIMADRNVRHLPVVDRDSMMGMISIRDVVKVMVAEHRQEMDQMQKYIHGMY